MQINIHDVTAIELKRTFLPNGNSRSLRIAYMPIGADEPAEIEIIVFGATDALEALPRAADFVAHTDLGAWAP